MNTSFKRVFLSIFCIFISAIVLLKLSSREDLSSMIKTKDFLVKKYNKQIPPSLPSKKKLKNTNNKDTRPINPLVTPTIIATLTPTGDSLVAPDVVLLSDNNLVTKSVGKNFLKKLKKLSHVNNTKESLRIKEYNLDENNLKKTIKEISTLKEIKLVVICSRFLENILSNGNIASNVLYTLAPTLPKSHLESNVNIVGIKTPYAYSSIAKLTKDIFVNKRIAIFTNKESQYHETKLTDAFNKLKKTYSLYDIENAINRDKFNLLVKEKKFDVAILITGNSLLHNLSNINLIMKDNKMPVIAFSESELKALEAIFSIGIDYNSLGKQLADLGVKILRNDHTVLKNIENPKLYKLIINKKKADEYKITIPKSILEKADIVIK